MAQYKVLLPELGEGVIEGTLTNWLVKVGDRVEEEDAVAEIATDKVDSEVSTSRSGIVKALLFEPDQVIKVNQPIIVLEVDTARAEDNAVENHIDSVSEKDEQENKVTVCNEQTENIPKIKSSETRFYSPLVKNIAQQENISQQELDTIKGSGSKGRVTRDDILSYITEQNKQVAEQPSFANIESPLEEHAISSGEDEIIQMDRMRKIIAQNMVNSKRTAPHVSSFVEVDLTKVVLWRNKIKAVFFKKEGEKITFTPIFIHAIARAIKDYPMVNIQTDGQKIIRKKDINIGMAVALSSGNLIVPVIKNADQYSLSGLTKKVNDLAQRARNNKLIPEEIKNGTYTMTNIGSFGNIFGTPIINQPQAAILAIGSIVKKPTVIETPHGDVIGIRHKAILSHSYDHRVIDGALGGFFVKRVAEYLEDFKEII